MQQDGERNEGKAQEVRRVYGTFRITETQNSFSSAALGGLLSNPLLQARPATRSPCLCAQHDQSPPPLMSWVSLAVSARSKPGLAPLRFQSFLECRVTERITMQASQTAALETLTLTSQLGSWSSQAEPQCSSEASSVVVAVMMFLCDAESVCAHICEGVDCQAHCGGVKPVG